MRLTLFKLPKVRQFDYKPLYFNPEKERRAKRLKELLGEEEVKKDDFLEGNHSARMKGAMRKKHQNYGEVLRKENQKSNLRLLAIIILLSILALYLYNSSGAWFDAMMHR